MKAKKSQTISSWTFVFPNDTNPYGHMFGGKLLAIMDSAAAMVAIRHSHRTIATAAVEAVEFKRPIMVGDRIKTDARIVDVGTSSMIVRVDVYVDQQTEKKQALVHATTAHFILVAFDDQHKPMAVPPLKLVSALDKKYQAIAKLIRDQAKLRRDVVAKNIQTQHSRSRA